MIGHTKNGGVNSRDGAGDMTSSTSRCGPESISYCYPGYWCPPASITPIQKRCGNVRFLYLIGVRLTHPKYFYSLSHVCTIHFFASTSSRPLLRVNFFFFSSFSFSFSLLRTQASVYCPMGSSAPTLALPGWYTVLGLPVEGEHRLQDGGDGNGVDGDGRRCVCCCCCWLLVVVGCF